MSVLSYIKNTPAASVLAAVFLFHFLTPGIGWSKEPEPGKESTKKPITVTSDKMEADTKENLVVFRGNVVAVETFTLCSDELFVRYDENKQISEILAKGGVRVFQDGKSASSAEAIFRNADRTIVLTGSPQVKQCNDTVRGDKITIYIDQKNALVESGGGGRVKAVIMPEKNCTDALTPEKGTGEETRCKGSR